MGIAFHPRLSRRSARVAAAGGSLLLSIGTFLTLAASEPRSDPAAEALVSAAATNEHTIAYQGEVVREGAWGGREYRWRVLVQHDCNDWTRIEVREPEGERGGVMLVRDGQQFVFLPDEKRWFRGVPREVPEDPELLRENYRATLGERESIAGVPTRKVALDGRCPGRPREVRWIADAPAFVLKSERWDCQGRRMSSRVFLSFRPNVRFDAAVFRIPHAALKDERPSGNVPDVEPLQPAWIPLGFRQVSARTWERHGQVGSTAFYTDGLATIVVSARPKETEAERAAHEKDRPSKSERGGDQDSTARPEVKSGGPPHHEGPRPPVVTWEDERFRYAVMGDVPEVELQRVARSVPAVQWAKGLPKVKATGTPGASATP